MGILIALLVVVGGCYAPDVRDCALACAADNDCVTGQVCTADHWCAAPALASGCGELASDAGVTTDGQPDAPVVPMVALMIHIEGMGMVTLTGGATCDAMDCTIQAPKDVPATLTAAPHGNHPFDKWDMPACMDQLAICHFTPTQPTTMITAKFH